MSPKFFGVLLVLCSTLIESCGQLSLKHSATAPNNSLHKYSWLTAGLLCFTVEAVVWSSVLRLLDVSIAYPMGSLSFVIVTLMSLLFLREKVSKERWLGVSLIIGGTALLGVA